MRAIRGTTCSKHTHSHANRQKHLRVCASRRCTMSQDVGPNTQFSVSLLVISCVDKRRFQLRDSRRDRWDRCALFVLNI